MKTLLCLLCLSATAFPQGLSRGERDRAMSELHATRKQFLDAVTGLSAAQWHFKPSDGSWSLLEIAEHIAASEESLFEIVTRKILAAPPAPEKKPAVQGKDQQVLTVFRDRSVKAKAPESLAPRGRWPTPEAIVERFRDSRDRTIAFVETTPRDLRAHFSPHPATGLLDAYQWILSISAHSARHVAQIEEVKAHPRFPR